MGSIRTTLLQESTLHGVNVDLSRTRMHFIRGQFRLVWYKSARYMGSIKLVCYKNALYMGSISTCLLQEGTLYGVNKD